MSSTTPVQISAGTFSLLDGITSAPTTGGAYHSRVSLRSVQATVAGTGSVSATVLIEVSNDGTSWTTIATITLSGTTSASDGFTAQTSWAYTRASVSAISGTSAAVSVTLSEGSI